MKPWHAVFLLSVLFPVGCAKPSTPTSPLAAGVAVAVFPPNNRTGDDPLVAGGTLAERYIFDTERVTVSDALAAEARWQLARRGYALIPAQVVDTALGTQRPDSASDAATLATQHHIDASVLYIELRHWEPNGHFNPDFVIVSIAATLIDPATGRVLWSADRPSRPVATPGTINLGQAYVVAAAKVMEELLAGLGPARPAAPGSSHSDSAPNSG